MGCGSPQHTSVPANIPPQHLNRLLQVANIDHPLNVNKKYEHLSKLKPSATVGHGFKKTLAYDCLTTQQEMQAKRNQFWETRVNGSPECWNAVRLATQQADENTGLQILQSMRMSMLSGSIQMCVDSRFNKYQVPVFCINEPDSYAENVIAQKNLNFQYEDTAIQLKVRSVKYPTEDLLLAINMSTTVGEAKNILRAQKNLADEGIRFFYNGREMLDTHTVGNHKYAVGTVVQAMIR